MSSCDSQGGKVIGVSGEPPNPFSLGTMNGRGSRIVRNFAINLAVSTLANSSSASPGSYNIIEQMFKIGFYLYIMMEI